MNINIKSLLLGTSLSLIPTITNAQCVATTDCATLGYTETSCPNGKGLKCPFGNTFACPKAITAQDCLALGYTDTIQEGKCLKCPDGEYWFCVDNTIVLGQCTGKAKNCHIADILYNDGTCSADKVSGKEPIGVVIYINNNGCGQALALEGLGNLKWSTESDDIPGLTNYNYAPTSDFDSCRNTQMILKHGIGEDGENNMPNYYPAFWSVNHYAPTLAPSTKGKWCLPAGGILDNINKNKTAINQSLSKIGKENIGDSYWLTSSEHSRGSSWEWNASSGELRYGDAKSNARYVRPVIEF